MNKRLLLFFYHGWRCDPTPWHAQSTGERPREAEGEGEGRGVEGWLLAFAPLPRWTSETPGREMRRRGQCALHTAHGNWLQWGGGGLGWAWGHILSLCLLQRDTHKPKHSLFDYDELFGHLWVMLQQQTFSFCSICHVVCVSPWPPGPRHSHTCMCSINLTWTNGIEFLVGQVLIWLRAAPGVLWSS